MLDLLTGTLESLRIALNIYHEIVNLAAATTMVSPNQKLRV
jgi:hypothetical protein